MVPDVDAFEQFVRGGAELRGFGVDETEVQIMRFVHAVYGPHGEPLQNADLTGAWAEAESDPGRAPRTTNGTA